MLVKRMAVSMRVVGFMSDTRNLDWYNSSLCAEKLG